MVRSEATAFTTRGIWESGDPVLLVYHSSDGSWQFLPGTDVDEADGILLHLGHILDRHPELSALADLPEEWAAERETEREPWSRFHWPESDADPD
jgi:hypothetical protein